MVLSDKMRTEKEFEQKREINRMMTRNRVDQLKVEWSIGRGDLA